VQTHSGETPVSEWDLTAINEQLLPIFGKPKLSLTELEQGKQTKEQIIESLYLDAINRYDEKEAEIGTDTMREVERIILLRVIDQKWTDHIDDMDQMRQGISLRAYAQRDPLLEYKFVSFDMFEELSVNIQTDTIKGLFNVRVAMAPEKREQVSKDVFTNMDDSAKSAPKKRTAKKVMPNDPCPCGSGKKYKFCCGRV
ncbi:MAG: SEC-C domain-containing protein, partial [Clostridiales bacterium]|nr:SEC-C domain-containing protein [Clostridiales bacterium]